MDHHIFLSVYDAYELLVPLVVPIFDFLYAVKYYGSKIQLWKLFWTDSVARCFA